VPFNPSRPVPQHRSNPSISAKREHPLPFGRGCSLIVYILQSSVSLRSYPAALYGGVQLGYHPLLVPVQCAGEGHVV